MHSRLVENLRPDNPLIQAPFLAAPCGSGHARRGSRALNEEVTRQAAMVAYINDFKLMMVVVLLSLPLLLLIRDPKRRRPAAAHRPRRRSGRRQRLNPPPETAARQPRFPFAATGSWVLRKVRKILQQICSEQAIEVFQNRLN